MLFNSYIFIFLFLPLALLGWYGLNKIKAYEGAKLFIAGMSLWFYGYFNLYYLTIIVVSILGNYLLSFLMKFSKTRLTRRIGLIVGLGLNLGLLFYFKYYDFFFENINALFHTDFVLKHILLPLGIIAVTCIEETQVGVTHQTLVLEGNRPGGAGDEAVRYHVS